MGRLTLALVTLVGGLAAAAGRSAAPSLSILLAERTAEARPVRSGCTYVGSGTFDGQKPSADSVVITMLGAVVATAHPCGSSAVMDLDLSQKFAVVGGVPGGKVRLSVETQLIGVLRGGRIAFASAKAGATVRTGETILVTADLPDRDVAGGENLAVNDRAAPDDLTIVPGPYFLHAYCRLTAIHPAGLRGKAASAEFAPAPALDPIWVGGPRDPFHGVGKKDFGFRVTLRVTDQGG